MKGNKLYGNALHDVVSNKQYDILSRYFGQSNDTREKVAKANESNRNRRLVEASLTSLRDEYDQAEAKYNKEKAAAEQKYNQAKIAINQDPAVLKQIEAEQDAIEDNWQQVKDTWQKRFDYVKHNPYYAAVEQARKDINAANNAMGWDATKTIGKKAYEGTKSALNGRSNLSPSFYRDVAAAMTGRQPGNLLDAQARTHKAQAKNQQNETANRQMEAQKSQQIADRNEYTEAGKVASMQNDAQNRQNIASKEGIAGSAAALMRQTNTPDVTAERTRQDQQRMVANERRQEADKAQQGATESMGNADQATVQSDIYNQVYDNWSNANNNGETSASSQGTGTQGTGTEGQGTEGQGTEGQGTEGQGTEGQGTGTPYTQKEGRPETEAPKTPDAMQGDPRFKAPEEDTEYKPSDATGLNKYSGMDDASLAKALLEDAKKLSDNYAEQHDQYERLAGQLKEGSELNRFLQDYPFPENTTENTPETPLDLSNEDPYEKEIVELVNEAIRKFPESNDTNYTQARLDYIENVLTQKYAKDKKTRESLTKRAKDKLTVDSDENLKIIHKQLSDCRMKWIKHDWDTFGKPSKKDFEWLLNNLQDDQIGIKEGDDFKDNTVLKGYADNIRNYVYNYKPEALAISPDNDPSVTHIGPMAQDIEKVNPACVSEDENGVKSVDVGRVAMMNTGAIGDIARSLEDIKARLTRLEAVNGN